MGHGRHLVALLALDDSGVQPCINRLRYAGTPTLLRQLDMAMAMGAEGLLLLARNAADEDVLAAQHLAERNGLDFRLIVRPAQLAKAVPDDAELLVFTPGLLVPDTSTLEFLASRPGMVTLPAAHEHAAGLERLDLHDAWAGVLRMPGALLRELEVLGEEYEPMSALPRIARSSGLEQRPLPDEMHETGAWRVYRSAGDMAAWRSPHQPAAVPGIDRLADWIASRNFSAVLPIVLMGIALAGAVLSLATSRPAIAIMFTAAAMLAAALEIRLLSIANPILLSGPKGKDWRDAVTPLLEIIAAFALGFGLAVAETPIAAGFASSVTLALIWIARMLATATTRTLLAPPIVWFGAGVLGAIGAWWGGAIVPTTVSLAIIALHMRASRRITGF